MELSAKGHERNLRYVPSMSGLPPKADMVRHDLDVRFVPKAEVAGLLMMPARDSGP
jgi:hypothetical protein